MPENSGQIVRSNRIDNLTSGTVIIPGLNGIHLTQTEAAGLGAYLGTAQMIGNCAVAAYQGLSSNPTVIVTGESCANQAYTQYENGNLGAVLNDIAYAESGEMDAMSGGLAGIGNQIAPGLGNGAMQETGAEGWECYGTSAGSWGNTDTLNTVAGTGTTSDGLCVTINLDFNANIVVHH